jgi:rhamnogalacturonyl hydrolase YesR
MDTEYRVTYEALLDPRENLFYLDGRFIGQRTPNGEKVFWSRGNAWVHAGLALVLEALPADYPTRPFYVDLFRRMSTAVLATQQPNRHDYRPRRCGPWYCKGQGS